MKICVVCGAEFENKKHPENQSCSKSCAGLQGWRTRAAKGREPGRHYPMRQCEVCGATFQKKSYGIRKTCSMMCVVAVRKRGKTAWSTAEGRHPPGWKGGIINKGGYRMVYVPDHPKKNGKGYVMEHRLVMERHIDRQLEGWEKVHHRNGVKADNRIENLEIVTQARPDGWVICPHCRRAFQVK